jgi:hypothetical protein
MEHGLAQSKVNLPARLSGALVRTLLSFERRLLIWARAVASFVTFSITLYQAYCCFKYLKRNRSHGPHA